MPLVRLDADQKSESRVVLLLSLLATCSDHIEVLFSEGPT
jgi:hypothetical protein